MSREELTKIMLPEDKMPKFWYNIQADMPNLPAPGLHPQTKPLTPADLEPIFARGVAQEVSTERYIEIPAEVRQFFINSTGPHPYSGPDSWKKP